MNENGSADATANEGAHATAVSAATAVQAATATRAAGADRGRDEAFRLLDFIAQAHAGVSVIGSMNADYTVVTQRLPKPGETINGGPLRLLPGGKSANQAAAAARIGADARMFGAVGQDDNAGFLLGFLKDAGVDASHVDAVPGPSGTTVITVDAHGENTIVYSAGSNASVTPEYVRASRDAITSSSVLGLCLESPMETVTACARMCHDAGMLVLLNDSPFVAQLPAELIEACDILLVNEHEMAQLLGVPEPANGDWNLVDWHDLATAMARYGFDRAIVTLGADGSVVLDRGEVHRISPVRVDALDTTGCGDAFMGTVLAGLASGLSLAQSAQCASYVSAYAATGAGAQNSYGTTAQIKQYFGSGTVA
ncbi:ribokinase [Bifidobacterium subtile]|uniref:Ribokinase n=1 Tax=Bifidobacterium subtile TaxID=77635 RepID=A0A087E7F9_9BIFI|nr:ribokinase [Bifidobacterium subtile]KFJ03710.1 putative ribokinase [Bifidobacterium subtile]QOL36210.1 ribokinase [Bifidobacterium subtile]